MWGTGYSLLTLTQMHALHKHDTSGLFPFTSLVSNIFVIIGGVFLLNDNISLLQWVAVGISVTIFIATNWNSKMHFVINILPTFTVIALLSTFNKFVQKFGASSVEVNNFIFWQLLFATVSSLLIMYFKERKTFISIPNSKLSMYAIVLGLLNFGSTYTIVLALSTGPISLVYVTIGLYTFFTTIFAAILFKEKITKRNMVFILLSFLVVLLIKFG